MKIYPVVFAFEKDSDFVWMKREFIRRIGAPLEEHTLFVDRAFAPSPVYLGYLERNRIRLIERPDGFVPWPSWNHCLSKAGAYRSFLERVNPADDDYVLDMDSDAFLVGTEVLTHLGKADFVAFRFNDRMTWVERFGKEWAHSFGAFQAMRAGALRKATQLPGKDFDWIRDYLSKTPGSHLVCDHFVPLMMEVAGATSFYPNHGRLFAEGYPVEGPLLAGGGGYSVLHLYGEWKKFAGHAIEGKYDIPRVMRKIGAL